MIELPTMPVPVETVNPGMLVLYGQSKIGKTTMLSQLDNCLMIDTEKGTKYVEGLKVQVNSLGDLKEVLEALRTSEHKYKFIAIDTIDKIAEWCDAHTCAAHGVATIGDLDFGKGYSISRELTLKILDNFQTLTDHLIVIGHRKRTIIGDTSLEVNTSSLDLTGRLRGQLMSKADAIGYVYRNDGELKISFVPSEEVECGGRCEHLRGKDMNFEWGKIYLD
jgi:hypothetical protein